MTQGYEDHDDFNDRLLSGGSPAAKFPTPGTCVEGWVVDRAWRPQTDIKTGAVKKYDDGNIMEQAVITLQTAEHDDAIEDDNGERRIFAKNQMLAAITKATRPFGGIIVGGYLTVTYTKNGEATAPGFAPPKQYIVAYEPPTSEPSPAPDDDDAPVARPEPRGAAKPAAPKQSFKERVNGKDDGPPREALPEHPATTTQSSSANVMVAFWTTARAGGFTQKQVLAAAGVDSLAGFTAAQLDELAASLGLVS